ncbi:MAG: hypothetical protein GX964_03670 [Syntrophomonadaceae bacterium]|nr:hypothetical protein [Syntrophomonadaceae bacterium]
MGLKPTRREKLWQQSEQVAGELGLPILAVNRALRHSPGVSSMNIAWGNGFILALALVLVEEVVTAYGADRLFLVGDFPGLPALISLVGEMGVPVVMQDLHPPRYEPIAHHLLYDQGVAMSVGRINPDGWGRGDAVLIFDPYYHRFAIGKKGSLFISLTDDSCNHAPELEYNLRRQGMNGTLDYLAPILESCLTTVEPRPTAGPESYSESGGSGTPHFFPIPASFVPVSQHVSDRVPAAGPAARSTYGPAEEFDSPQPPFRDGLLDSSRTVSTAANRNVSYRRLMDKILSIKQAGQSKNVWGFFLDKDFRALYNTIKGSGPYN